MNSKRVGEPAFSGFLMSSSFDKANKVSAPFTILSRTSLDATLLLSPTPKILGLISHFDYVHAWCFYVQQHGMFDSKFHTCEADLPTVTALTACDDSWIVFQVVHIHALRSIETLPLCVFCYLLSRGSIHALLIFLSLVRVASMTLKTLNHLILISALRSSCDHA